VHKADILPPSCAVVTKSGNLNFLEPSGSLQACNGTALPYAACLFKCDGGYSDFDAADMFIKTVHCLHWA